MARVEIHGMVKQLPGFPARSKQNSKHNLALMTSASSASITKLDYQNTILGRSIVHSGLRVSWVGRYIDSSFRT